MINLQGQLNSFANNNRLQQALETAMGAAGEGIAVSLFYKEESYSASINHFSHDDSVQIGCIAKSLTATLIAIAQSEGKLKIDTSIASFFMDSSFSEPLKTHLLATKIFHLLNHSNGFDNSTLELAPKQVAGMIDIKTMLDTLGKTKTFSRPEAVFNYNNVGPWLAAAILEHVYKKPYAELLNEHIFIPLKIKALNIVSDMNICPSIGQDLRLSAQDLIKIGRLHLQGDPNRPELLDHLLSFRSEFSFPTPKWSPAGERCYPAWFDFNGSMGQLGYGEGGAGVIRLLPGQEAVIVVTATHQKLANATLAMLFKDILKGFEQSTLPQLLSSDQWAATGSDAYKGTFENAKYRLYIDIAGNGSLRGKVYRQCNEEGRLDTEPFLKRYFKAAADHFFLSAQPEQLAYPILAFSHPDQKGQFQTISTSLYVFSRVIEN